SCVFKFDSTYAMHGSLGYAVSSGATSAQSYGTWVLTTSLDRVYGSIYLKIGTFVGNTSAQAIRFKGLGTQACRIVFSSTGFIKISDTATSNSVTATGTAANAGSFF